MKSQLMWIAFLVPLAVIAAVGAVAQQKRDLERDFQAASAQYDPGTPDDGTDPDLYRSPGGARAQNS